MKINEDIVPSTIEQAVNEIVEALDEDERNFIKSSNSHYEIHHTVGRHIRNSWSLWEPDTPLKRDAVNTYEISHADDISGLIFAWVWAKVRVEEFDPMEQVEIYHKHWAKSRTTSLEAGGWTE